MRRILGAMLALSIFTGCHSLPVAGPLAGTQNAQPGTLRLTLHVPPQALPGYQTATIPGGSSTVLLTLTNPALLGGSRTSIVTLVGGQTQYTVTLPGLPVGSGYTLSAEARNASGTRLAFNNQLDPSGADPTLNDLRTLNPYTTTAQSFIIASGTNNVNMGLRILSLAGTDAGATASTLVGGAQVMAGYKRSLAVNAPTAVNAGYVVTLGLDTATLVAAGKLKSDMSDLHVLYWDGSRYVDLARYVESPNNASSRISFRTQAAIAQGATDSSYWLTYGTTFTAAAPGDRAVIYDCYDGFEYANASIPSMGWNSILGTGTAVCAGSLGRNGSTSFHLDTTVGNFSKDMWRNYAFPANFCMTVWFFDNMATTRNDWIEPSPGNATSGAIGIYTATAGSFYDYTTTAVGWTASTVARSNGWHKYEFQHNNGTMTYLIDGTQVATASDTRTYRGVYLRGGGSTAYSSTADWDDLSIRALVSPEPGVTPGSEQVL